jgi:hypothetical protein
MRVVLVVCAQAGWDVLVESEEVVWAVVSFELVVLEGRDGITRLISRNRFRLPTLATRIGMLPMEPGSLVMERKMLRGMKARAERVT